MAEPAPGHHQAGSAPQAPRGKSRTALWIVTAVIVVLAIAAVAAVLIVNSHNKHVAAEKAAAKAKQAAAVSAAKNAANQALQPFVKLDSALTVGVVFADYGKMVQDAQYAFDSYQPADDIGNALRGKLKTAMSAYVAADDAWNDVIQSKFTGKERQGSYWISRYPVLANLSRSTVKPSDVEQEGWYEAGVAVLAAQVILKEYGK